MTDTVSRRAYGRLYAVRDHNGSVVVWDGRTMPGPEAYPREALALSPAQARGLARQLTGVLRRRKRGR